MTAPRGTQRPANVGKPKTGAPSKPITHERPKAVGKPGVYHSRRNVPMPKTGKKK